LISVAGGDVSGSYDFGYQQTGSSTIGDTLFYDWNGDGTQDVGDEGIPNVTVKLYLDANGNGVYDAATDAFVDSTITADGSGVDPPGFYDFTGLPAGNYIVVVDESDPDFPNNLTPSAGSPGVVSLPAATSDNSVDFGYQPFGSGAIGDTVWYDKNGDGAQLGSAETGLANIDIQLLADLNGDGVYGLVQTTSTDANGNYQFNDLPDGDYRISVDDTDPQLPLDPFGNPYDATTSTSIDLSLNGGATNNTADFGFGTLPTIGDMVFLDANNNADMDLGEVGIANVTVNLRDAGTGALVASTTTADGAGSELLGSYRFTGIQPGEYTVEIDTSTLPAGITGADQTADPDRDGVPCDDNSIPGMPAGDNQHTTTVAFGDNLTGVDFGYEPDGVVGDYVWFDQDGDGIQDADEVGLAGVEVTATLGATTYTTTTDFDGRFTFQDLTAGDWTISINTATLPAGMTATSSGDINDLLNGIGSVGADSATVSVDAFGNVTAIDGNPVSDGALKIDFGYETNGDYSVTGRVVLEQQGNTNGVGGDATDTAVSGLTVYLYNSAGDYIGSATTDASGGYAFTNLLADDYFVALATNTPTLENTALTTTQSDTPASAITDNGSTVSQTVTVDAAAAAGDGGIDPNAVEGLDFAYVSTDDYDYGDLPQSYKTDLSGNPIGPRHTVPGAPTLYLGSLAPDADTNGQPSVAADGDGADEDGVSAVNPVAWSDGTDGGSVQVTVTGSGWLVGWIDFDNSGTFGGPGEMIINQAVSSGTQTVTFDIPAGSIDGNGGDLYARFRLFEEQPAVPQLAYTGTAMNGEVEDHRFTLPARSVTIGDASVTEGGSLIFDVSLSAASNGDIVLDLTTTDGSATGGSDYEITSFEYSADGITWFPAAGASGTEVTVPAGDISIQVRIDTLEDLTPETAEDFTLSVAAVVSGPAGDTSANGVGAINDNENSNTPPVIDLDANNSTAPGTSYDGTFVEDGGSVNIVDTDFAIVDPSDIFMESATIVLTNAQPGDNLNLPGSLPAGIAGFVDTSIPGQITVTLTGTATIADYETAVRGLTFNNTNDTPSLLDRSINISVNDGDTNSNVALSTIHVIPVNDAPTIAKPADQTTDQDTAVTFGMLGFGDVDAIAGSDIMTVALSVSDGTLTLTDTTGLTFIGGTSNGEATLQIQGTPDAFNAALNVANSITYDPDPGFNGSDSLSILISDGGANGDDPSLHGQPNTGTNSDEQATAAVNITVNPAAAPDLYITKDDGNAVVVAGDNVSYTINYGNDGTQGASGVMIAETLPPGATFDVANSTAGWVDQGGGTYTFAIGNLASGVSGSVVFAVVVDDPLAAGIDDLVNNVAIADDGANGADEDPTDNSDTDTDTITAAPDLYITKNDGNAVVVAGDNVSYTINYGNDGTQDASGVVITETLPPGATFDVANSTAGWVDQGGGAYTFAIGNLASGISGSVVLAVVVDDPLAAGIDNLINNVAVSDDGANGGDEDLTDNSDTDTDTITIRRSSLAGNVYFDADNDGTLDGGESGLGGVNVRLQGTDHVGNAVDITIPTQPDGSYLFDNLRPGTYSITEAQPSTHLDGIDTIGTPGGTTANDRFFNVSLPSGTETFGTDNNFGEIRPSSLSGFVYHDSDNDGDRTDEPAGSGIQNVTITLTGTDDLGNAVNLSTTTDVNGFWQFTGLRPSDASGYTIMEMQPAAYNDGIHVDGSLANGDTSVDDVTSSIGVTSGDAGTGYDFGERGASISGTVFVDDDRDGTADAGELNRVGGITIELYDAGGSTLIATTITAADGTYRFDNVPAGDYLIRQIHPAGYTSTSLDTVNITLPLSGLTDQDFGEALWDLGDFVWFDADGDGVQDAGEPGLANVDVTLLFAGLNGTFGDGDDVTQNTTANATGLYQFTELFNGEYRVTVDAADLPARVIGTAEADDSSPAIDGTSNITVDGADRFEVDFGYRGNGSIGDTVFFDYVGDGGPFNPAENDRGMAGVDVTLEIDVDGDSNPDYAITAPTDANGNYQFDNLIPGTYAIATDPNDLPDQMGNNPTFDADGAGAGSQNTSTLTLGVDENNTDQDFGYHATPDYRITKDDGLRSVVTGESVSYTVTIRNNGTLLGQNVVVTDNFPTNILTNVAASDGGIVDPVAGTITWNATTTPSLAFLDVLEQVTLTVTGDLIGILDGNNQPLVNAVSVTDNAFNGIDPNLADNSAQDLDQIVDITTLKNVTDLVANGDNWDITFELTVENTGSVALEGLTLFDDLATQFGAAFVAVTNPVIDSSGMTGGGTPPVVNPNWPSNTALDILDPTFVGEVLMPGERFTVTFTATLDPDATGSSTTLDNQANGAGTDNTTEPGNPRTVNDDSDSGIDPTSTNPDGPGDTGTEDNPTPLYIPDIAIAKLQGITTQDPLTHSWLVDYTFFVENIGTVSLDSLSLTDDIATEFGNAFVRIQAGSLSLQNFNGTGIAPAANLAWEGDTSLEILNATGSRLDPGDSFEIIFTVEIDPDGVDGLSQPLENQATVSGRGLDETGQPLQGSGGSDIVVNDDSDSGADPNGTNPNEPGDAGTSDDPTMLVIPEIGAAKRLVSSTPSITGGNRDLTYEIVIRNLGTVDLMNLTLTEDLDQHLSGAFVGVSAGGSPTIAASNATQNPTLNVAWDGNLDGAGDANIFAGSDGLLLPGEEITISFTVEVDVDQLKKGSNNQVDTSGFYDATPGIPSNDGTVTDLSDTGTDPADTNPGNPGDSGGFDDPTLIPAIGIAKDHGDFASVGESFVVPITLVIENLGTTDLNNLTLVEDLQAEFGTALLSVSTPVIDSSGMAIPANGPGVNAAWESDTAQNMFDGTGLLEPGDRVVVTFDVFVDPDATGGSVPLDNQSVVTASDPINPAAVVADLSDSGTDPGLSNPGEPGDTGSAEDPTPLQIPDVGVAKRVTNATQLGLEYHLTIELVVENTGTVDLDHLQLFDDLAAQYGPNFGRIVSAPRIVASTATADPNLNPAYATDTTQNVFDGASGSLQPGESITIGLIVEVVAAPGQSEAMLVNQAQGGGAALDENALPLTDSGGTPLATILDHSDSGSNPNTNNPTAPGDTGGLDDPTPQDLTFYTFDSFNDHSSESKGLWEEHERADQPQADRILTKEISNLAPEPIFSGSARPGTQVVGRAYNSVGVLIGEAISFADVGGNWMMQFHELASQDHARFEFVELAGIGSTFAPRSDVYGYLGTDARDNDYAALEPWTPYGESYEFSAVYRQTAGQSLALLHRMHQRPIGLGSTI